MGDNIHKFGSAVRVGNLGTAPSQVAGVMYWDTGSGRLRFGNGSTFENVNYNLVNANIDAAAAIAYSKLNLSNSIVNADVAAGAAIVYSKLSLTNSILNADINASAGIVYSKLSLTNSIVNADINASAAIAYSKLNLSGSIVNADINASAAIAYSKLALSNSIVNADIATAAAIDAAKIADGSVSNAEFQRLDGVTSSIQTQLNNKLDLSGGTLTGFLTLHADPVNAMHAVTKQYVDALTNGLDWKNSVRAASTANVNISNGLENGDSLDGVTLATGNRVALLYQTAPAENGIYIVPASGAATRSLDMDSWSEVPGAAVFVEEGTVNADKAFVCTSDQGGTLGTTAITFVQFSSANAYVGGNGIDITGNTISVKHDGEGLTFSSTNLALELDGSTLSKSASGVKVADQGISNAQVNNSAAIAYSKLNLSASIVNADIASGAAIAYSKLNLSNSIVNADIASGAAIALNKLAALTASRALQSDGSGVISVSAVTSTELGYLSGVTSSVQTQLDNKVTGPGSSTDEALARFDGTTGKLVQNSSSNLSDSGSLTIADTFKRGDGNLTDIIEEEYLHNATLTSSTTAVLSALSFDGRNFKELQLDYMVKNGNDRRGGTIYVVCNNASGVAPSSVSLSDQYTETADVSLSWSAAVNGNNIEISYTTSSGTYRLNADLKRFQAN